ADHSGQLTKENSSENTLDFDDRCGRSRRYLLIDFSNCRRFRVSGRPARPRKQGRYVRCSPTPSERKTKHVGGLGGSASGRCYRPQNTRVREGTALHGMGKETMGIL